MYTWYVNCMGDVQIYEGDVSENNIYDYVTIERAELHKNNAEEFVERFVRIKAKETKEQLLNRYKPCKYYIEDKYADMFFTCIGEVFSYGSGCTNVDVSEFLD